MNPGKIPLLMVQEIPFAIEALTELNLQLKFETVSMSNVGGFLENTVYYYQGLSVYFYTFLFSLSFCIFIILLNTTFLW